MTCCKDEPLVTEQAELTQSTLLAYDRGMFERMRPIRRNLVTKGLEGETT
jgi:hypothetical protein